MRSDIGRYIENADSESTYINGGDAAGIDAAGVHVMQAEGPEATLVSIGLANRYEVLRLCHPTVGLRGAL